MKVVGGPGEDSNLHLRIFPPCSGLHHRPLEITLARKLNWRDSGLDSVDSSCATALKIATLDAKIEVSKAAQSVLESQTLETTTKPVSGVGRDTLLLLPS